MALVLKAARINAGKTVSEVAKITGKTKSTIRNYESYKSKPDIETAYKIADFYGMSVDDISWSK